MTVHIGDHIHPVASPSVDLVVDHIAPQEWRSAWLSAHDETTGEKVYLAAEDAVLDGGAS